MSEDDSAPVSRRGFLRAATGATAAGAAVGQASAQEDGGNESGGGNESDGGGGGGGGSETVTVGPGGELRFDPEELTIQPGTTIVWEWDSAGHNVMPDSIPEESDWNGHEPLEDAGFTYEHTFEAEGTFDYVCTPHEQAGMVGSIEVTTDTGGGGGGGAPQIPDSAKTLGIASVIGMLSTLGLAYFFLRFGGDYESEP
jgi:plastocyanin